jgi:replication factor A1
VTLLEDGADIGVGEDATAGSGPTSSTGSTGTRGSDDHDRPDGTAALGDFSGGAAEAATETETTKTPPAGGDAGAETGTEVKTGATTVGAETIEFTGTVVQAGDPVVLDDGESTLSVETDTDLRLGQQVTIRGQMNDGRLYAEDVF